MKNKLELWRYRRSLKKDFFKNVIGCPEDTKWRKAVLDWVVKLYDFHGITIPNLDYLFSKYENISFPVQYDSSSTRGLIDSSGNKIYFMNHSYHNDIYIIGKRDSSLDISFNFKLLPINKIILYRMHICPLNSDGSNKNYMLVFEYHKNRTTVSLDIAGNNVLTLSYPRQDKDFDIALSDYLFTLVNDNFYDVAKIFITLSNMISNIHFLNITSFDDNGYFLSEIQSSNGFIDKYMFTIKISEFVNCSYKINLLIPIKDFITSPSKVLKDLI